MEQIDWDIYFLRLAREVSKNSKCLSRKIGAVLVKDKSIISTGYNGPAKGVKHCDERDMEFYTKLDGSIGGGDSSGVGDYRNICPRRLFGYKSGQGLHLCQAGHAERNSLIQAARNGISTLGTTLYCDCPLPCLSCMIEIINSGVKRLVYLKGDDYDKYSRILLEESKIEYTEYEKEIL
jgi:dCMP deaminase